MIARFLSLVLRFYYSLNLVILLNLFLFYNFRPSLSLVGFFKKFQGASQVKLGFKSSVLSFRFLHKEKYKLLSISKSSQNLDYMSENRLVRGSVGLTRVFKRTTTRYRLVYGQFPNYRLPPLPVATCSSSELYLPM